MTGHRSGRPWEIEGPQPAILALADAGMLRGRLLDAGCGTGENALLAAARGADVTGIDLDDSVLAAARHKAVARGLTARFLHADATRMEVVAEALRPPFDVALDRELFHMLTSAQRHDYLTGVRGVLRAGGRFIMLCYGDTQPDVPHRVRQDDIRANLKNGRHIEVLEPATIDTAIHPNGIRGWLTVATRMEPACCTSKDT